MSLLAGGKQQNVALALVIALRVKVLHELAPRASQRGLAKQDQFRQALLLHRADPSFRERVEIRASGWQRDRLNTTRCKRRPERRAEFPVPIMQNITPLEPPCGTR